MSIGAELCEAVRAVDEHGEDLVRSAIESARSLVCRSCAASSRAAVCVEAGVAKPPGEIDDVAFGNGDAREDHLSSVDVFLLCEFAEQR